MHRLNGFKFEVQMKFLRDEKNWGKKKLTEIKKKNQKIVHFSLLKIFD